MISRMFVYELILVGEYDHQFWESSLWRGRTDPAKLTSEVMTWDSSSWRCHQWHQGMLPPTGYLSIRLVEDLPPLCSAIGEGRISRCDSNSVKKIILTWHLVSHEVSDKKGSLTCDAISNSSMYDLTIELQSLSSLVSPSLAQHVVIHSRSNATAAVNV